MPIDALVLLVVIAGPAVVFYICAFLHFKFGLCRTFYHDILAWHQPDNSYALFDGCSVHCRCKYCGQDIMQDSQGNWF